MLKLSLSSAVGAANEYDRNLARPIRFSPLPSLQTPEPSKRNSWIALYRNMGAPEALACNRKTIRLPSILHVR